MDNNRKSINLLDNYPFSINKIRVNSQLSKNLKSQVIRDRREIVDIVSGKDKRLLLIVGPCSAWPSDAVLNYAKKLKAVSEKVKPSIKIVLRVYTQKPRTISGWNGSLLAPNPFASQNPEKGIRHATNLMGEIIKIGLPIADEALFLAPSFFLKDFLSWVAIGARSSENQEHRCYASEINMPVGIKNPTSGSIKTGINSVLAAQSSQISILNGYKKITSGNSFAHIVLRGSQEGSNIKKNDLEFAVQLLKENNIKNPSFIIDVSHGNCIKYNNKDPNIQISNVLEILELMNDNANLAKYFKGFMIESFLKEGSQNISQKKSFDIDMDGLSITDPCLSWDKTEKIILEIFDKLNNNKK